MRQQDFAPSWNWSSVKRGIVNRPLFVTPRTAACGSRPTNAGRLSASCRVLSAYWRWQASAAWRLDRLGSRDCRAPPRSAADPVIARATVREGQVQAWRAGGAAAKHGEPLADFALQTARCHDAYQVFVLSVALHRAEQQSAQRMPVVCRLWASYPPQAVQPSAAAGFELGPFV